MSALNGDKSRYQINRKRKMLRRQRIQALLTGLRAAVPGAPASGQVEPPGKRARPVQ